MVEITPREIDRDTVRTMVRRGAQLVEVLPREAYDRLHLAGAINIPMSMFSRHTADKLKWDQPVIVYAEDSLDDRSARAAWRLSSLGFTQLYRYTAGKADWSANGLPVEGTEARSTAAGDFADLDVPTCARGERVGEIRERVYKAGWKTCVVVTDQLVVLGLLRSNDLEQANPQWPAEEAMDRDPQTYRLNAELPEISEYLKRTHLDSALITTTGGKLFGLLKREALEKF